MHRDQVRFLLSILRDKLENFREIFGIGYREDRRKEVYNWFHKLLWKNFWYSSRDIYFFHTFNFEMYWEILKECFMNETFKVTKRRTKKMDWHCEKSWHYILGTFIFVSNKFFRNFDKIVLKKFSFVQFRRIFKQIQRISKSTFIWYRWSFEFVKCRWNVEDS